MRTLELLVFCVFATQLVLLLQWIRPAATIDGPQAALPACLPAAASPTQHTCAMDEAGCHRCLDRWHCLLCMPGHLLDMESGNCVLTCPSHLIPLGRGQFDRKCGTRAYAELVHAAATGQGGHTSRVLQRRGALPMVHKAVFQQISAIIYISLAQKKTSLRVAREQNIREELAASGWGEHVNITRVVGVELLANPVYGRVLSHLVALETGRAMRHLPSPGGADLAGGHVLVLEDQARVAACSAACLVLALFDLERVSKGVWDVALLGGEARFFHNESLDVNLTSHMSTEWLALGGPRFVERWSAQNHAYIVHRGYLPTLIDTVRQGLGRMSTVDAAHSRGLSHMWREWQRTDVWFAQYRVPSALVTLI